MLIIAAFSSVIIRFDQVSAGKKMGIRAENFKKLIFKLDRYRQY